MPPTGGASPTGGRVPSVIDSGCQAYRSYDDGYQYWTSTPSSGWATIVYDSATVRHSGSIRSFIEVSNINNESNNLIVGILNTGAGPQLYMETGGQFIAGSKVSVSKDSGYAVALYLDSSTSTSSTWHAEWWDFPYTFKSDPVTINYSDPPMDFWTHTETTNTTCNEVSSAFKSLSFPISSMQGKITDGSGKYKVTATSSTSFTVTGP